MTSALLLLLLSAAPFPTPKSGQVNERTRCDWGTIVSVSPGGSDLILSTPAGSIKYQTGLNVPVFAADGKPAGAVTVLKAGNAVRVYYEVSDGAKATEIDFEA